MMGLSFQELLIIGVIAVILFGKRLPDVAKSLGAQYRDFRRGLGEIQSQMDFSDDVRSSPTTRSLPSESTLDDNDFSEPTAPKLDLPPADAEAKSDRLSDA